MEWSASCSTPLAFIALLTLISFLKSNDMSSGQTITSLAEHINNYRHFNSDYRVIQRVRKLKIKNEALINVNALGTSSFVFNRTVFGALLPSGYIHGDKHLSHLRRQNQSLKNHDQQSANAQHHSISSDLKRTISELPFPVVHWPPVATKTCPSHRYGQMAMTGLKPTGAIALAHYQIWLDFIYFDHDVIQAVKKNEVKKDELYSSTYWSSTSGVFLASINGSLHKNGTPYYEDDIMIIFEDNVQIAVSNVNQTMKTELSSMTTDLLYLGWRDARNVSSTPPSPYAYAITRRGARIAVKYFDPCRPALDEQFAIMMRHKWLTYRTASPTTYNSTHHESSNSSSDQFQSCSHGIFRQRRDMDENHPL